MSNLCNFEASFFVNVAWISASTTTFEVVRPWYVCLQMLKIEIIWFQPITHKDKKQINLLHDFLRFLGTHFCMKINLKIAPVTYIVSSGSNCNWASMKIFWFGMLNMPVFYFVYSLFILVLFSKKVLRFYYLKVNNASLWIIYHLKTNTECTFRLNFLSYCLV